MYSLGGGCQVKWALDRIGIRNETFFFDYMWNLKDGLNTVTTIMKDNFEPFLSRDNYEYVNTHPILNWDYFHINKYYPDLAFMHYDIRNDDVFASICRKVERTRQIFQDDKFKIFVYFRGYYTGPETIDTLRKESELFVKEYSERFNTNFKLISLIEVPKEEEIRGPTIVSPLQNTNHIYYDFVMHDEKEYWDSVIQKYKSIIDIERSQCT